MYSLKKRKQVRRTGNCLLTVGKNEPELYWKTYFSRGTVYAFKCNPNRLFYFSLKTRAPVIIGNLQQVRMSEHWFELVTASNNFKRMPSVSYDYYSWIVNVFRNCTWRIFNVATRFLLVIKEISSFRYGRTCFSAIFLKLVFTPRSIDDALTGSNVHSTIIQKKNVSAACCTYVMYSKWNAKKKHGAFSHGPINTFLR